MGRSNIVDKKAIFLDRDGVINKNVYYEDTKEWESPRILDDFHLIDNVISSLKILQENDYHFFIVTNQPSYAKGKTTLENLEEIISHTVRLLEKDNIKIQKVYCSFKHEKSIYKDYLTPCNFRKPNIGALMDAKDKFQINLNQSWMIGDRDTDIECGLNAGTKTIKISPYEDSKNIKADYNVSSLKEASVKILSDDTFLDR